MYFLGVSEVNFHCCPVVEEPSVRGPVGACAHGEAWLPPLVLTRPEDDIHAPYSRFLDHSQR